MEKIGTKIFFRALLFLQTFHILLLLPPTLLSWDLGRKTEKYQWCKTFTVVIRILQTLLSVRLPNTFAQTEIICNALNSVHASVISVSASAASFGENATTQLLFLSSVFLSDEKEIWVIDSENAWWFQWSSLSKNKTRHICVYLIFDFPPDSLQCLLFTLCERKFVWYWITLSDQGPLLFFCQHEGSWTLQLLHSETYSRSIYIQPLPTVWFKMNPWATDSSAFPFYFYMLNLSTKEITEKIAIL